MKITKGDIYYARLENTVGSEQHGYRPVLVIQNNKGNEYSQTVIVASITSSTTKKLLPTHVLLPKDFSGLPEDSTVLLEQIHTLDKSRLEAFVGHLPEKYFQLINKAIMHSFELLYRDGSTAPMFFRTDNHKRIFTQRVVNNPNKCSNEYLAVLYLLTADTILWKNARRHVKDNYISLGRVDLRGITPRGYALIKVASDIQNKASHISVRDFCDKNIISDKTYQLIHTAIQIGRNGYNAMDCVTEEKRT